jgi:hypothetical protein
MTTTTISTPHSSQRTPTRPGPSRRFALDPYRIEEMTWTRSELLQARGQLPEQRAHRRRVR